MLCHYAAVVFVLSVALSAYVTFVKFLVSVVRTKSVLSSSFELFIPIGPPKPPSGFFIVSPFPSGFFGRCLGAV